MADSRKSNTSTDEPFTWQALEPRLHQAKKNFSSSDFALKKAIREKKSPVEIEALQLERDTALKKWDRMVNECHFLLILQNEDINEGSLITRQGIGKKMQMVLAQKQDVEDIQNSVHKTSPSSSLYGLRTFYASLWKGVSYYLCYQDPSPPETKNHSSLEINEYKKPPTQNFS